MLFVLLFSVNVFAQDAEVPVEELELTLPAILNFFLPAILGSISMLFADAKKWFGSEWDWNVFWQTKIKPFLISIGIAVGIYVLLSVAPFLKPAIEALSGVGLVEASAYVFMLAATGLVDNFLKKKKPAPEPAK